MLTLLLGLWLSRSAAGFPLTTSKPVEPRSEPQASAWKEGPDKRGTQSLLLSCFVTLFFAAWTSYHPNVPPVGSGGNTFITRLKWVSVAVFAPEIVLWKAWSQYFGAKRFLHQINKAIAEFPKQQSVRPCNNQGSTKSTDFSAANSGHHKSTTWPVLAQSKTATAQTYGCPPNTKVRDQEPWTLRQALFASSGGVAVRTGSFHAAEHACLTEKGLLLLAKCGVLPSLPLDQVKDKSKADTFQKIIVCVQGLWFVAQTTARWLQHLPVSLLELHAFIHVFCALAMFVFWWQKGYDIGSPIILDDDISLDLAALFSLETAFQRADDVQLGTFDDPFRHHCSHDGHAPTRFQCVRNAHAYPPAALGSWAWFKIVAFPSWVQPRPVDNVKIMEQCRRVERAVRYLQRHAVHVYWQDIEPRDIDADRGDISTFSFDDGPYVAPSVGNIYAEGCLDWRDLAHPQLWKGQLPDEVGCLSIDGLNVGEGRAPHNSQSQQSLRPSSSSQRLVEGSRSLPLNDWSWAASEHNMPRPVLHSASWSTPRRDPLCRDRLGARAATAPAATGTVEMETLPRTPKDHLEDDQDREPKPALETILGFPYDPRPDQILTREVGYFTILYRQFHLDKVALVLFCGAYGGAHIAAWNHTFPTTVEMWLWRGVCLFMLTIPIYMLLYVFFKILETILSIWGHWERMQSAMRSLNACCAVLALCSTGTYSLARMFLLAEALAALRKPVPGTYEDVSWSKYVPHVS